MKGEQNMKKYMIKFCALAMAAMMTASPVSRVRAAEGTEGTKVACKDVQETEIRIGDEREKVNNGGITTYGCSRGTYIVKICSAKVRSESGTSYPVLTTLNQGKVISVSSVDNGWAKFKYGEWTAYISKTSLKKNK